MIPPDDLIANIEAEIAKDVKIARGEDWHAQEERHWPDWIRSTSRSVPQHPG